MSTTIEQPRTATQRGTDATAQLREIFNFDNLKAMSTAITEAATEEARHNSRFAERVRVLYQEIVSTSGSKKTGTRAPRDRSAKFKVMPIHKVEGYEIDPLAPLDPYFFLQIYGREQFPLALEEQTLVALKGAANKLMRDNPGTKPTSKAKKDAVIAYIVGIVTGEGV